MNRTDCLEDFFKKKYRVTQIAVGKKTGRKHLCGLNKYYGTRNVFAKVFAIWHITKLHGNLVKYSQRSNVVLSPSNSIYTRLIYLICLDLINISIWNFVLKNELKITYLHHVKVNILSSLGVESKIELKRVIYLYTYKLMIALIMILLF